MLFRDLNNSYCHWNAILRRNRVKPLSYLIKTVYLVIITITVWPALLNSRGYAQKRVNGIKDQMREETSLKRENSALKEGKAVDDTEKKKTVTVKNPAVIEKDKAMLAKYMRESEMARIRKHYLHNRLGELEKSLKIYGGKYKVEKDRDYHFYMGFYHETRGDYRKAVESYLHAIDISGDYTRARNSLGNLYCRLHKYHFALPHFRKAMEINPYNPFIHFNMGSLYLEIGDLDNALIHLEQAVSYKQNFGSAYHKLGILMFHKKQYMRSIDYLNRAVSFNSESHSTHYYMGLSYYFLERGSLAIASMKKALQMKPDFFEAALELGKIHHSYGEFSYALDYYNRASSINPDFKDLRLRMVECHRELKQYQDAIKIIRNMLAKDPENEVLQRYLKNLQERKLIENLEIPHDYYGY